jgi:hypothetical protein
LAKYVDEFEENSEHDDSSEHCSIGSSPYDDEDRTDGSGLDKEGDNEKVMGDEGEYEEVNVVPSAEHSGKGDEGRDEVNAEHSDQNREEANEEASTEQSDENDESGDEVSTEQSDEGDECGDDRVRSKASKAMRVAKTGNRRTAKMRMM